MRLRIDCAYDGTEFCGWARQPGLRSVQGELEQVLGVALRIEVPRAVCAGRTDAGVHARGQVVHVDIPDEAGHGEAGLLLRRLNGLLPADIRVRAIAPAPEGFDARWSALRRHYSYSVTDHVPDPLRRSWVVAHPHALDVDRMSDASSALLGEHDFAAFCREREGASSVRTLLRFEWSREDGLVTARLSADAFCHSMVRSLVGAMLPVGDGRWPVTRPAELLAKGVRDPAVTVAPPHGLVLEGVDYPDDAGLRAQAQAARRWRGDPELNPNRL